MNDTLITLIIGVAVGVGLSLLYLAYRIKMVMNSLDKYIEEAIDTVTSTFVKLIVEKDNDTYYCYRKEDRQFVCQGSSIESLLETFKEQYPDKNAIIAEGTDQTIIEEFKEILNK